MVSKTVLAAGIAACATPGTNAASASANPIRKVVMMLQNMETKVKEEGETEAKLYDEFMCSCKTGQATLSQGIESGKARIEALAASINSGSSALDSLKAQLAAHQSSRAEAKQAAETAKALRAKEAAAFSKEEADTEQNLRALEQAISAVEKGVGSSFIQSSSASALKKVVMEKAEMSDDSRQELLAFLSGTQDEEYAPQSGEIVGILKQMSDQMADSLSSATKAEHDSVNSFESLMQAKTREIDTLTTQIEEEMMRVGEGGLGGANSANDLEDAKQQLKEDTKYLADLEHSCATKTQEHEEAKQLRAEELVALADTIKVLNSDDSLELFKKALPSASASFVQVQVGLASTRAKALAVLRRVPRKTLHARPELDLIALALHGKQAGFEKVIGMVDSMVANLKNEQQDDDAKRAYCNKEFDAADDKKKGHELSIADSETAIEELKGSIAQVDEEIKALKKGIRELDKSVAEATEMREAENAEYKVLMTNDPLAKEVLLFAKNRLNKFYNPKLYKAPPKRELSREDQLVVNMGGTLAPTAAPSAFGGSGVGEFVQISAHRARSVGAPKTEQGNGVIAMIDLLVKDLDKEMQQAKVTETASQGDYEALLAAAKEKRAEDSTSLTNREAARAEATEAMGAESEKLDATKVDLMQTAEYIHGLHVECDWLLKFYDTRKEARDSEIDALGKAKAVLSGADFSLVQTDRQHALRR